MLLFYLLIVFVWSGECSRNQREEYPTGGAGESKMRFKRAIGGEKSSDFSQPSLATLWSDRVRHSDASADSRFYGMGRILHPRYLLAPKPPLLAVLLEDNKGNLWDKHIQIGDELTQEYYTGVINVKEGVRRKDGNPRRQYGLKYIGDATEWFGLVERIEKGHDDEGWKKGWLFNSRYKNSNVKNCEYLGWSQQLQNGTKKADIRYFVEIPVRMTNNSCSDHVCQFDKSDGLPGGFCNTFQESGSLIWCDHDVGFAGVTYIVVQDPKRPKIANCTGRVSAYHVPYLMDAVRKVLMPGGHDNDSSSIDDELALEW